MANTDAEQVKEHTSRIDTSSNVAATKSYTAKIINQAAGIRVQKDDGVEQCKCGKTE